MKRSFLVLALSASLSGCVTTPIPEGYTGPTAVIRDSAVSESGTRAAFFYVSEVNGRAIRTSLMATRTANQGRGFALAPSVIERAVPAGKIKLKLEARNAYGAPIQEILMAGSMYSAEQTVETELQPDGRYVVRGHLARDDSAVWLEEESSGRKIRVGAGAK